MREVRSSREQLEDGKVERWGIFVGRLYCERKEMEEEKRRGEGNRDRSMREVRRRKL